MESALSFAQADRSGAPKIKDASALITRIGMEFLASHARMDNSGIALPFLAYAPTTNTITDIRAYRAQQVNPGMHFHRPAPVPSARTGMASAASHAQTDRSSTRLRWPVHAPWD